MAPFFVFLQDMPSSRHIHAKTFDKQALPFILLHALNFDYMTSDKITVIAATDKLATFCHSAKTAPYITLDTEFLRERTYFPKLALIQAATPETAVIIDPLSEELDLSPFWELMQVPEPIKVFHAMGQDMEIFLKLSGALPQNLFDTQIAAMFCGYGMQASYASLVRSLCKANLSKAKQFSNWIKRPLSDAQLTYALADVTYLRDVYQKLGKQLEKRGRTSWFEEEMEKLCDPALYSPSPDTVWQKVRSKNADAKTLSILKELGSWREHYAMKVDRPRGKIIRDDALLQIAHDRPKDNAALAGIRGVPDKIVNKEAQAIFAAIEAGLNADNKPFQAYRQKPPLNKTQRQHLQFLKFLLEVKAEAFDLAPQIIASASELEDFISGDDSVSFLIKHWKFDAFGADAKAVIHGELQINWHHKNGLSVSTSGNKTITDRA